MRPISDSVGRGGSNKRQDVLAVQGLLNRNIALLTPLAALQTDGRIGPATIQAIEEYQRRVLGDGEPSGLVAPGDRAFREMNQATSGYFIDARPDPGDAVSISGKKLPEAAKKVLTDILQSAGLSSAKVTSVARSPAEQARVMYENIAARGTKYNYKLYGKFGDQVIKVFDDNRAKSKADVVALMAATIIRIGPSKVSKHCSTSHYVFDVAPSSLANRAAFAKAAKAHPAVSRLLGPPGDPAYHVEIPKAYYFGIYGAT